MLSQFESYWQWVKKIWPVKNHQWTRHCKGNVRIPKIAFDKPYAWKWKCFKSLPLGNKHWQQKISWLPCMIYTSYIGFLQYSSNYHLPNILSDWFFCRVDSMAVHDKGNLRLMVFWHLLHTQYCNPRKKNLSKAHLKAWPRVSQLHGTKRNFGLNGATSDDMENASGGGEVKGAL